MEFALTAPSGPCSGNHELTKLSRWMQCAQNPVSPKTCGLAGSTYTTSTWGDFHPRYPSLGANWETHKTVEQKRQRRDVRTMTSWPTRKESNSFPSSPALHEKPKIHGAVSSSPRLGQILVRFFGASVSIPRNARLKTSLGHHSLAQPDPSRTSGSNLSLPATAQVTIMEPSYSLSKFKTWHAMPLPQVRWRPPKDHRMPVTRETQLPVHLLQPVDLAIHFRRQPLKVFEDGQILPMVFTNLVCVSRSYKY